MRPLRRPTSRILALGAALGCLVAAPALHAAEEPRVPEREKVIAILDGIPASGGPQTDLRVEVVREDGSGGSSLRVGDRFRYRFSASRDVYLTVLHVDAHGLTTVLYPSLIDTDTRIRAGTPKVFPVDIEVAPPLGREDVFAVASPKPILPADLGLSLNPGRPYATAEGAEARALAERLGRALAPTPEGEIAITQAALRIGGRGEVALSKNDILEFLTVRTRSVRRPRLDMPIEFATGSAELDERARRNLDQMGEALNDPRAASVRHLVIEGHTDDVGEASYNQKLSEQRAAAVLDYLTSQHGIDPERLRPEGLGEAEPKESGTDELARQANRRVEFEIGR